MRGLFLFFANKRISLLDLAWTVALVKISNRLLPESLHLWAFVVVAMALAIAILNAVRDFLLAEREVEK